MTDIFVYDLHPEKALALKDKLSQVIAGVAREETTFFKSVGMALFDVCASKLI